MSWNLFNKHNAARRNVTSNKAERDLERETKKLEELDEATKKLYKDMKKFLEANTAVSKSERRISSELLTSGVCQFEDELRARIEDWDTAAAKLDLHTQELNSNCQKSVMETLKKLSSVFPSIQNAIKKREQFLQEYIKCQAKLARAQEKERTGPNLVKLEACKKASNAARDDFESHNVVLVEEIPRLSEGRVNYLQPSLEALIRSQITYYAEAFKIYSELATSLSPRPDMSSADYQNVIQQKLSEIRALSITVDD